MSGLNLGTGVATGATKGPDSKEELPVASAVDNLVRFSSHPIMRYKIGRFRFADGLLTLASEQDVSDFRKTLGDLPLSERNRIRELDVSAAEAQVRAVLAQSPGATKGTDSSTGDRQPNNQVGKGKLEDLG